MSVKVKKKKPQKAAPSESKKLLLFGFHELPAILAAEAAAKAVGAETVAVPPESWDQTLASLAESAASASAGKEDRMASVSVLPGSFENSAILPKGTFGRMVVLCGLDEELDALLPALRGFGCPKAVLTERNRSWTAGRLYRELQRERQALEGSR